MSATERIVEAALAWRDAIKDPPNAWADSTDLALIAAVDAYPRPQPAPCPEGFHWIGQPFTACDACGLPAWDHAGMAVLPEGAGPFGTKPFVLQPWEPGVVDKIRVLWDPTFLLSRVDP
jgi:hypothetical protein